MASAIYWLIQLVIFIFAVIVITNFIKKKKEKQGSKESEEKFYKK